jgi:hypothetical protein
LIKTFRGWRDQQLPDGTVIWRSPPGQTYVTTPGSAAVRQPVRPDRPAHPHPADRCAEPTARMPKRRRARAQNHANYIADQRRHNRQNRRARQISTAGPAPRNNGDDEPPPL